jgi:small-conductance mechanosensitive channel
MDNSAIKSLADLLSVSRILVSLAIILTSWLTLKGLLSLTQLMALRFGRYRLQISRFFPIARVTLWTVAFYFIIVYVFKPETQALLALTASLGIALGLALQDVIKNILAGIVILLDQPFRVGDMIKVGPDYGEVLNIGLRSVRIRTFDDSLVTLPNSVVVGDAVSNSNTGELNEMVVIPLYLPATVDPSEIKRLGWEAAASSPYVYMKKPITITIEDHFQRTFLTCFKIKAYVSDVRLERRLATDVTERIKKELIRRGVITERVVLSLQTAETTD